MWLDIKLHKPRPLSIVWVSIYVTLLPCLMAVILGGGDVSFYADLLRERWAGLIFYAILGLAIFSLNNKLRLAVVIILSYMALAAPIGMVLGVVKTWSVHLDIIRRFGFGILVWPWATMLGLSLLVAVVPFYLTRANVKELFKDA